MRFSLFAFKNKKSKMIHDILLSLMSPNSKKLAIEIFIVSDAVSTFMHPGEKKILEEIIQIIHKLREIAKFTKEYGVNLKSTNVYETEEPLQKGLYLQAFAAGIDKVLEDYFKSISELEKSFLQNPSQSLLFIFHKVNVFQPLFHFIQRLIRGIRSQKLHGCAILQYIHQNMLHGNKQIARAMKTIQSTVNIVFLKQISHWMLYGKIVDHYGEFFIQCSENKNNTLESDRCTSAGSGKITTATSDATSTYADIWRYEIYYEFLPHYLSPCWAEKVLFIGQTVLMFKVNSNKSSKEAQIWNESEKSTISGSLWNDREYIFFKKIQDLQETGDFNISQYEKVVDEIKTYVTERLSQIAVDQADLIKQLRLIKDFYLLGRGELFLEFIKRTYSIGKAQVTENTVRDIIKAFDLAAHSVNVSEDLEQFTLTIPKERVDLEDFDNFGYLQHLSLQYKINWPLHLLFSPKVIDRYNELFRFLLLVKKMQYELHMVWCNNRKHREQGDVNVLKLRNQLMFLLDNLQYYIQVDVLESQFSILMNTVLNSSDFEHIQKAHSIFQANVLSLCFLISNDEPSKISVAQSVENPVYSILNKIFNLCEAFCTFIRSAHKPMVKDELEESNMLQLQLAKLIEQLLNLLVGLKADPSCTPLSQLLLRLDFNYWFSTNREKNEEESESTL